MRRQTTRSEKGRRRPLGRSALFIIDIALARFIWTRQKTSVFFVRAPVGGAGGRVSSSLIRAER
jgi:hypothetical protein